MNRNLLKCGRTTPPTGCADGFFSLAVCVLVVLCFGVGQAAAQYGSKTIATSSPGGFTITGFGVAVDNSGNVYATEEWPQGIGDEVREISPVNALIAGSGNNFPGCSQGATQTQITNAGGLAVDGAGNLYVGQSGNGPVLEIRGGMTTCLTRLPNGNGVDFWARGVTPDNAGGAYFSLLSGTQVNGIVYGPNQVLHVTAAGALSPIVGIAGQRGCGSNGLGIGEPYGLAVDASGTLYIADQYCNVVWKFVPSAGSRTLFAGSPFGVSGYRGDGGPATQAQLFQPEGVAVDPDGNVYIADWGNNAIRMVRHSDGTITTIAGTGLPGNTDDPNNATNSTFNGPRSIAVGPGGNVYVGEDGNHDVRELTLTARALMISPPPGSVLTSPSTTFTWTSVADVDQYRLTMGSSAGGTDYFDDAGSNLITTTDSVPNVPCDGRPVYVQLFTKLDGYWLPAQQYIYTAPAGCAQMISPSNGSVLGMTQTFSWSAAPGARGYRLTVSYISPSGSAVTNSYPSTAATSLFVNNLPCDGKPVLVQLSSVLSNGTTMPPGNYAYTACKMLYLSYGATSFPAQGGTFGLLIYVMRDPPFISDQLSVTELQTWPRLPCVSNPLTHQLVCPTPATIYSTPVSFPSYGPSWNQYSVPITIPPRPAGYQFAMTQYTITTSITVNGIVVDSESVTVTRN